SVVVATGTASGKSLAYLAPVLSTLLEGSEAAPSHQRQRDDGPAGRGPGKPPQGGGGLLSQNGGGLRAGGRGATALYLAPTKALAADQRRAVRELAAPLGTAVRPAVYDGDTPVEEREWVRQYANYVLTNPDML